MNPISFAPHLEFQQDRKLVVRILEARNLTFDKNKSVDAYTMVSLDKREERTPVIFNNPNPFWSEEYAFEDLEADFSRLSVTVWNKSDDDEKKDEPFGQVLFPRALVTAGQLEEEQWFALCPLDAENAVSGDIRLKIAYFPPKNDIKTHTFAVNVIAGRNLVARDLNSKTSSPYVVLHLLPDLRVKSTQITKVDKNNLNPVYNETFIFVVDDLRQDLEMHLSVWHQNEALNDVFMGHSSIPIGDVKAGNKTDRWYTLLPKPAHIENLDSLLEKRKKMRKSDINSKAKAFALALQISDIEAAMSPKTKKNHKLVDVKLMALSFCGHCSGIMWAFSTNMQCKECRLTCHQKCAKFVANNCGGVPMLRLKIKYSAIPVLPEQSYDKLISIIAENDFAIATLLGKLIQEREEAAKTLVKIYETQGKVVDLLKAVLSNEINAASDTQTLFRANSMASKALDVYMKFVGSGHLKQVLGPIVNNIAQSNKNCEVDPSRLTKKDDLNANWKNLLGYIQAIVHAIFSNTSTFPYTLRAVFHDLQKHVQQRFPKDDMVKYTAVSGFIFLRFFAPAILGPKLFGLMDDYANAKASRSFTLLAKTLQSLSNLTEFGQKEPYMSNMNSFIVSKMPGMKNYIDEISTVIPIEKLDKRKSTIFAQKLDPVNLPRECARIYELFVRAAEKLVEGMSQEDRPIVVKLLEEMSEISKQVEVAVAEMPNSNAAKIKMSSDSEEAAPAQFASAEEESEIRAKLSPRYSDSARPAKLPPPGVAPNSTDRRPLSMSLFDQTHSKESSGNISVKSVPLKAGMFSKFNTFSNRSSTSLKKDEVSDVTDNSHIETSQKNLNGLASSSGSPPEKLSPKPLSLPRKPSVNVKDIPSSSHDELDKIVSKLGSLEQSPKSSSNLTASALQKSKSAKDVSKQQALLMLQQAMQTAASASSHFIGKCEGCSQGIIAGVEVINYENQTYHKEHFTCSVCDASLLNDDKPVYVNSSLFCKKHNPLTKKKECAACEQELLDVVVEALGKSWHKDCFNCTACGIVLSSNFLVFEGLPYCKQDYLKRAGLLCGVCGEYIETGRKYHTTCKRCDHCNQLLAGRHFFSLNGSILCSDHRDEFSNCRACRMPILGQVLVALQKQHQYHAEHFNCKSCDKNLATLPFFEKDDQPICQQCLFRNVRSQAELQ